MGDSLEGWSECWGKGGGDGEGELVFVGGGDSERKSTSCVCCQQEGSKLLLTGILSKQEDQITKLVFVFSIQSSKFR